MLHSTLKLSAALRLVNEKILVGLEFLRHGLIHLAA